MDEELEQMEQTFSKIEYIEKLTLYKEFNHPVFVDSSILEERDYRGMIFSVY